MRFGVHLGYWGSQPNDFMALASAAERLGFDSVWSAEAYGSDAVTLITWAAAKTRSIGVGTAVMQMPARTPAATAMTAITLDHLTGGRFRLGLGTSGPQVVEGWHGVGFGKPLQRTREYVEIIRRILRRDEPVEFHGEIYDVPVRGGSGLGKPLKTIVHPLRSDLPIYLAAIGPRNVALAAEIADGWLPTFYAPAHAAMYDAWLDEGFARAGQGGRSREGFDVAPMVSVVVGEDVQACRDVVKPALALYVGGMGARGRNFYNDLVRRYGYEEAADAVQSLYLDGRKGEAAAAIPDALVDDVALVGPSSRIAERLSLWRDAGVTTLIATAWQVEALEALEAA